MTAPYSIGRNCRITVLWRGSRIDLKNVSHFQARQITQVLTSRPCNSAETLRWTVPDGWQGHFSLPRADRSLDKLFSEIESSFRNAGIVGSPGGQKLVTDKETGKQTLNKFSDIPGGKIYQYISEPNGSTTTIEYNMASFRIEAGQWRSSSIVNQIVEFYASTREVIS